MYIGNEGFVLIGRNNLGQDLETIFSEIYQERIDGTMTIRNVINVLRKKYESKLLDAFTKNTGVNFKKLHLVGYPCGYFAVQMFLGDKSGWNAHYAINRFCGLMSDEDFKKRVKTISENDLIKLTKDLNDESKISGKLKFNGEYVGATLFMDPWSAFFAKDVISKHVEYMTPKELAGIYLHETGHQMTLIENAAYAYYRIKMQQLYIEAYLKDKPASETVKIFKKYLENAPKNPQNEKIKKGLETIEALEERAKDLKDSTWATVFNTVIKAIGLVQSFIMGAVGSIVWRMLFEPLLSLFITKTKTGDVDWTARNMIECERLADEYVARFGYSSSVATGLDKIINQYGPHYGFASMGATSHNRVSFELTKWTNIIEALVGSGGSLYYDEYPQRIEQLMLDNIKAIKSENLPKEIVQIYIDEYDNIKRLRKKHDATLFATLVGQNIWGVFDYLVSPKEIYDAVMTGRFHREYESLLLNLNKLSNNPLYIEAARLKNSIKDK